MKYLLFLLTLTRFVHAVDMEQIRTDFNQQKYTQVLQDLNLLDNTQSPLVWYYLSQIYGDGLDIEQDIPKAVKYLQKSAVAGIVDAQSDLAQHYYNGDWVKRDNKQAVHWWVKAEQQGDANASYALGRAYFLGQGVEEEHKLAKKWYQKALLEGSPKALSALQLIDEKQRIKRIITEPAKAEIAKKPKIELEPEPKPIILDDNDKVKRLSPSFYIVQLISIADGEKVTELKKTYHLPKLRMIHYKVKEKDRYALLQGHYPTKTSAKRAIKNYPKALSKLKPWIRKVSTIQKKIYQNK